MTSDWYYYTLSGATLMMAGAVKVATSSALREQDGRRRARVSQGRPSRSPPLPKIVGTVYVLLPLATARQC